MKNSPQDILAQARRDQILDAAIHVFAQKGFHLATIKDIARQAGLADGTLYLYFENKTALLFAILERMRGAVMPDEAFVELAAQDFAAFLRAFLLHPLMAFKADHFALFRVIISEMLVNEALREQYFRGVLEPTLKYAESAFQGWAAQGLIRPDDITLSVRALSALILGLLIQAALGDEALSAEWDALPDFLVRLLLPGLKGA